MTATLAPEQTNTTTWTIDATHSSLEFGVKHLMITTVKGRFGGVQGTVVLDESHTPATAAIDIVIDATSIDTRNEQRDNHLRSADFFDVAQFPTLRFVGGRIEGDPAGEFRLSGDLTIRGVTRPITLRVEAEGQVRDPWGGNRASYSAKAAIKRSDWGLTWNQALEAGGVVVSDDVKLSLDVQLVRGV